MSNLYHTIVSYFSPPTDPNHPPHPNYGSTAAQAGNGLQTLPADPSKIEPKVWLASERTFLNYLRVAVLLSSFALALFNSASSTDHITAAMGVIYALIGAGMVGYAWAMQERRRKRIIERWSGSHDEIVGPVVIIALIFLAVAVNFGLRVGSRERLRDTPSPKNPWGRALTLVASSVGVEVEL